MKFSERQKAIYLIAHTKGIGNVKGRRLIQGITSVEKIHTSIESFRGKIISLAGEKEYAEMQALLEEIDFGEVESRLTKLNIDIVCLGDDAYPKSLLPYEDMPLIIYCKGDISLLNKPCFAVVGTRYPTKYGLRATEEFTASLVERFCIVSGMARGVDSKAHRVALDNRGKTICVLGCGVDVVYPSENYALYQDIASYGLVISEYAEGTKANACNFPARNRIISGLSEGVLITEAGLKSGTFITHKYALEQGKDVYCVPGSIYNASSGGCNRSIRECQSRAVLDVNDIYDEMGINKVEITKPSAIQLDINEEIIVNCITQGGEMHFEELLNEVDLTVPQLNSLLTKMEMVGLINKTKSNYWSV